MRQLLQKLHARIGDFWWYSLMLFVASRAADLLNAFVGLWLVPKYVDPSELGAVLPLAQFANFLAIPAAAFASAFRNEVSRLSVGREFGKLKTLMRGVFIATAIFLFLAIVVARFTMPLLLERIRVVEGSLGIVIIAVSFIGTVAPIYSNALQALKKFREQSLINIIGAPIRLITMLVAMPFRAITGYFVGQATTPAFSIVASVFSLRKEFSAKAEPYWSRETSKKILGLFLIFALGSIIGGFNGLIESTIIRQRLPDLDSAGYYMATRFSEIAGFLAATLSFTIFPFTAEKAASGKGYRTLVLKSIAANFAFCAVIAIAFVFCGKQLLSLLPHGENYLACWWAIPCLIGTSFLGSIIILFTTAEVSAHRFGWMKWYLPLDLAYPIILLIVTGCGYYIHLLPTTWATFLVTHNIRSLDTMLFWIAGNNLLKAIICLIAIKRKPI